VFHNRKSLNAEEMRKYGKETQYFSLAPSLSVKWMPSSKAPMMSLDYERGVKVNHQYISYERWEADASYKQPLCRTQQLNLRFGGGLYTAKDNNFFMDFANFRDNNIPGGWDDDFTGNFQLLNSRLYNESKYYLRGNVSFETPLMAGYLVPIVGRYVERERVYVSSLSIDNTRLYSELGYGFTCRIFSMGIFTSFLNYQYQDMGCKFTFELFNRL
jgi:outer membrane receptor for Fe3+-dicitrate